MIGHSTRKLLLTLTLGALAACAARAQFTFTHLGSGATGSLVTNDAASGSYTLNGGGDDIWSATDNFDFAHYTVVGDFDLKVRIDALEPVARWTKAGIMARELLVPAARMAFTRATPGDVPTGNGGNGANDIKFSYRTGVIAGIQGEHEDGNGQPAYPNCWLRLTRAGAVFGSFFSHDGTNWTSLGTQDSATWEGGAMPAALEFGLGVGRHSSSDTIATCEYRDLGGTPVNFSAVPQSQTVSVGQSPTFTCALASGFSGYVTYQWLLNGAPITGANGASYTKSSAQLGDSGSSLTVLVSNRLNGLTALSPAASLTVVPNPQIASVTTKGDPTGIYVTFSKVMNPATLLNTGSYSVDGGVSVTSVALWGNNNDAVRVAVAGLTFGTTYHLSVGGVEDTDANAIWPNPSSATFLHGENMTGPARLTLKRYDNIGGAAVSDLTGAAAFPCSPNYTDAAIPTMEYGLNPAHNNNGQGDIDNYGSWMYGIFTPAASGTYRFGVSSDDSSSLYLSTDSSPASRVLLAAQSGYNDNRTYAGRITPVDLVAGRSYYMEVYQKDGCCGDHVTVAMQEPGWGSITNGQEGLSATNFALKYAYGCPPRFFFSTLGPIAVTHGPGNQTATEFTTAKFTVELDGSAPYGLQWYREGTAIPGATGFTLNVIAAMTNNNTTYFVVAHNDFSSVTSAVATLTVTPAVQVLGASSRNDATGIYVQFNKTMNASAADPGKYGVSGGVTIGGATLWSPDTIRLEVPALASGSYTVTVHDVQSAAGDPLFPNPATASFTHFSGTFTASFASLPPGGQLYGSAVVESGILKLTTNVNSLNGAFLLDDFTGGQPLTHFRITWNALIGGGSSTPADGYSFNLANDLPTSTYGSPEEGGGTGLTLSFDTYDNGGGEAPAIDVRVGGQQLVHYPYQVATGAWVPVVVELSGDGKLYVNYNNRVVATNIQTTFHPAPGARFGFGGRTGGLNENNWVDDLSISVFTPGNVTIISQPHDVTVNERDIVNWSIAVDGSSPYAIQWFSNGVAIAGATASTLSFTALRFADSAVYTVAVTNGFSTTTSAPWTLHVINDVTAPVLASRAAGSASMREITLTYSEPVNFGTATNTANYAVTNSTGAALAITGARSISTTQIILTTDAQVPGERYAVVANNVVDRSGVPNAIAANSAAAFTGWVLTPGFVLMETYETGGGTTVPLLRNHATYPYFPRERFFLTALDSRLAYPDDSHDNYGGRISGVFLAPTNGDYMFYVANDDDAEVYSSASETGAGKSVLVTAGCCGTWNTHSTPVTLSAGDRRYLEILWKEGGGGDYGRLSIDASSPIGKENIAVYANPDDTQLFITHAPQNRTSSPHQYATFTVTATNTARLPQLYQWQRSNGSGSFTNIPGAFGTNRVLVVGPLNTDLSDSGAQFRVIVYTPGTSASATATLTVVNDTTAPTMVSAHADESFSRVYITYSEPMDTDPNYSLLEPLSYTLDDGVTDRYAFSSVTLLSPTNVVIVIDPSAGPSMIEGRNYRISVCCVQDANGNPINEAANFATFTSYLRSRGFARYDFYLNIPNTTIADLFGAAKFPNSPDVTFYTNTLNWPQSSPDMNNYGLRMSGYFRPPVDGSYVFSLKNDDDARFRLSTDENPANLATVLDVACCNGDFYGAQTVSGLQSNRYYYFEAYMKEGGGGDYLTIGVRAPGSLVTAPLSGAMLMSSLEVNTAANAGISQQPHATTVAENRPAWLTVAVTNTGGYAPCYQWQMNAGSGFTDVPGANSAGCWTPALPLAQNGAQFRAVVYLPGQTLYSQAAAVTVLADTNRPVLLSAASANGTQVGVRFDERISGAAATDVNNFLIDGVAPLSAALRPDGSNVLLIAASPVGQEFTLVVSNIADIAATPNVLTNASVIGRFWLAEVVDIGSPLPAGEHFSSEQGQIELVGGGSDVWGTSDQFTYTYMPRTNDFDVKVRLDSLKYAGNNWAKAGMNVRESTAANSRMVWFYPTPLEGAHQFEGAIRFENGGDVTDFGQPRPEAYFPAWLRLVRVGSQFSAYLSPNGTNWSQFGTTQTAAQFPERLLVGVGVTSHNNGTPSTAPFAEFGDTIPHVTLQTVNGRVVVSWDGTGELQCADEFPAATWTVLGTTSPYLVPLDLPHRYFRVKRLFPMP